MRPAAVALIGLSLAGASAGASVTVPPFAAPDELVMFSPEVSRAVAFTLDRAGVDVGGTGPKAEVVAGKIEAIDRDRVRLKASAGGHTVQVEGPLERIDELSTDLGGRLATALPASARRPPGSAPRLAATPPPGKLPGIVPPVLLAAAALPAATPPATPAPAPAPAEPPAPAATPPVAAPPPPADKPPAEEVKPPPADKPATPPPADPAPVIAPPPVLNPYPASPPSHYSPPANPYLPPPQPPVYPPQRRWRGGGTYSSSGRTVLHSIGTPDGCATGTWATYAARDVLERRLHLQTISTGACGFLSQGAAAAEAQRSGVHSVVMASFESLRLEPGSLGMHPVGRLRVIVVRDGQVVLDRTPELNGRSTNVPDLSRAAYDLVAEAFGLLANDLAAVLNDAR